MGFNAKKAMKSADKALAGLDSQIKAGNAARAAQADTDMSDIRKDMADKTAARVASNATPKKMSFNEAFRAARQRGDKTFSWAGKPGTTFTTNLASDKKPSVSAPRSGISSVTKSAPPAQQNKPASAQQGKPPASSGDRFRPGISKPTAAMSSTIRSMMGSADRFRPGIDKADTSKAPADRSLMGKDASAAASKLNSAMARAAATTPPKPQAPRPAAPKKDVWAPGAKPSGGRLLLKDNGYAKGGKIDGIAKRGLTRAKRK